jgi:protein SCO1/2
MTIKRRIWLTATLLAAVLAGCGPTAPQFNGIDITGADYAQDLVLTDAQGAQRQLADFRGKLVVVFFGFAQCPDVCPSTLAAMAAVKQRLGADADKLQVLFVTVDPERDTPAVLAQYTTAFDPSFVGLYGTLEDTARVAKHFKVFYQKVPGKTPSSYTIDHTAGSYVFDKDGRVRLFLKHGQSIEATLADLKQLL